MLAWVAPLHGWARLRRSALLGWAVGLAALLVVSFVLIGIAPTEEPGLAGTLGLIGLLAVVIAGTAHALVLRPKIFGVRHTDPSVARTTWASMSAVTQVEQARACRAEARQIVERDPSMARELRIGRPDLPGRTYDDGGLVDLNHVHPDTLAQFLELDSVYVEEISRARGELHGFSALGELAAYTSIPAPVVDGLGERAIFLRY
jgi:hypothetical protein